MKEALVGIDVAHAGQQRLIEQRCFDREVSSTEERGEFLVANCERLGAGWRETRSLRRRSRNSRRPKRRGSTKRSSCPPARSRRACVWSGNGAVGCCDQQPTGHAKVDDPLRCGRARILVGAFAGFLRDGFGCCARWTQLEDDMFPGAVYCQYRAASKTNGLPQGRRLEGLRMAAEPSLDDAIATHAFMNAAGDRLHFWEFRHRFIVEDRGLRIA